MKHILSLIAVPAMFLSAVPLLSSCSSCVDEPESPDRGEGEVSFRILLPSPSIKSTRGPSDGFSYSDGTSVNVLKCYVYNQASGSSAEPVKVVDVDIRDVNENRGGDVSVLLPKGQTFDVVFLATSVPQDSPVEKLFYSTTDRTLNVNYSAASGNDEGLDCFFASRTGVTSETVFEEAVTLARPFAQLNIGTKDYAAYDFATPVRDVAVSVSGVYDRLNLMDGSVDGTPVTAVFNAAPVPSGQSFPVKGVTYLSMSYLLVNLRKLVDISVTVSHANPATPALTLTFPGIAVERNYQTNLYGNKLLSESPSHSSSVRL